MDIACGSGLLSRRMAQLGAQVVAIDASKVFLERAKARTVEYEDRIQYALMDATPRSVLSLGERRFDAAVCNNALMDMPTIRPLADSLSRLLKPNGRFVFSVTHSCFNAVSTQKTVEQVERDGQLHRKHSAKMSDYINGATGTRIGIEGQPRLHYNFDLPLSQTLNTFFDVGFVLDGIAEPVADQEDATSNPFSWANYTEIPSQLTARLRLVNV
ncbi:MAG: class I SAM-dependent methyltransferase [SAR202 cluster bacterium]|nr:class I SAM-dependent methyltransferase [SAR202 cluster bacterium]